MDAELHIEVSETDAETLKAIKNDPRYKSAELYPALADGHQFKVGDSCVLVGLEDFPEYNGETVEITAIREDGSRGRAYYIEGRINEVLNWVYEYRLSRTEAPARDRLDTSEGPPAGRSCDSP